MQENEILNDLANLLPMRDVLFANSEPKSGLPDWGIRGFSQIFKVRIMTFLDTEYFKGRKIII